MPRVTEVGQRSDLFTYWKITQLKRSHQAGIGPQWNEDCVMNNRVSHTIDRSQMRMEANVRENRNETLMIEDFWGICCVEIKLQDETVFNLSHIRLFPSTNSWWKVESLRMGAQRTRYNVKISNSGKHQVTIITSFIQSTTGAGHRTGCYKK